MDHPVMCAILRPIRFCWIQNKCKFQVINVTQSQPKTRCAAARVCEQWKPLPSGAGLFGTNRLERVMSGVLAVPGGSPASFPSHFPWNNRGAKLVRLRRQTIQVWRPGVSIGVNAISFDFSQTPSC